MANKTKYSKEKSTGYYFINIKTGLYKKDGTPDYKRVRAKTIKRLEEKEKRFREELALGMDISETKLTVEDWAKYWFISYKGGCAESTKLSYQRLLNNHTLPVIGRRRIKDVTEAQLQKLLNDLSQKHYGNQQKQYTKKLLMRCETFCSLCLTRLNQTKKSLSILRKSLQFRVLKVEKDESFPKRKEKHIWMLA